MLGMNEIVSGHKTMPYCDLWKAKGQRSVTRGMNSPWKSVSCLKIMQVCFAGCL